MGGTGGVVSPDDITGEEFKDALAKYSPLIESISAAKGAKANQQTLLELDKYRYGEAVEAFGSGRGSRQMDHDAVTKLVSWKLRHGTFRPALMKNVTSNDPSFVRDTIKEAMDVYRKSSDVSASVAVFTKLKGIGPATASLLLAVHDPASVIFFSDEAFYWLCCGGKKDSIKYNPKEYKQLNSRAQSLVSRLGVSAVDVEKVAFVTMKSGEGISKPPTKEDKAMPQSSKSKETRVVPEKSVQPAKRKQKPADEDDTSSAVRRSKRGRT